MSRDTDVHTCSEVCPCHTGGEPTPDFAEAEGLTFLALLYREYLATPAPGDAPDEPTSRRPVG